MKIALINENSQAAKNELIFGVLDKVAKKYGHKGWNKWKMDNNYA